jgi:hypothetical protein
MAEYITLLGSEQVQSAGRNMLSAASDMQRAASTIDESLAQHQSFLDDWLLRLQAIMEKTL